MARRQQMQSTGEAHESARTPDLTIDSDRRARVIDGMLKHLSERYVFPDVAERIAVAIRQNLKNGEYDHITSALTFAETLRAQLREISQDQHVWVNFSFEPLHDEIQDQDFVSRLRSKNFCFEELKRLRGNIGYMKFSAFVSPEHGGETAAAAMTFLANTAALVIDLRENGGGDPAMVALISSYLFDSKPVHLNSLYWRPEDFTHQWWTLPHVPGARFGPHKSVFVLTSSRTFSAAEEFAYNLQNLKRATIIGEVTRGGAHPGGLCRIDEHFTVGIPSGRAINPVSKTNWEGTGVKPDVEVPADQALKTAHLAALREILEKADDQGLSSEIEDAIENLESA